MATIPLNEIVSRSITDEQFILSQSSDKAAFEFYVLSLKGINSYFFIENLFVKDNIGNAKNCLYKIGMTNAYYHEVYNGEIFNVLDTFVYPVLAGSQTLIDRYLAYTKTQHEDSFSTFFGKGIQCIWRKDNEGLARCVTGLEKWVGGEWEKSYSGIVTSFKGFLNKDVQSITNGINEMLAKHNEQNQPSIIKDYINVEAAAIAKLAIENGYALEGTNRLVPYSLLRSAPNEQYVGYSFFDENN